MDIGKLTNRVKIQESTEVQSASGEPTQTWITKYDAWASVQQMSGTELFQAQAVNPGVTHKINIWHRNGITTKMRVLLNDRELNIESVDNIDERNRELVLICKENV